MCTPAANPPRASQATLAEPAKEKTLHAVDTEGIRAEGQAAAMAAIAAAQAQVNGQSRDESRGNVGDYWGRSNSEEDLERADSGELQVGLCSAARLACCSRNRLHGFPRLNRPYVCHMALCFVSCSLRSCSLHDRMKEK